MYVDRIHAEVLYGISKSSIKAGIAGRSIVSPYIAINPKQLSVPSMSHAERLIFSFSTVNFVVSHSRFTSLKYFYYSHLLQLKILFLIHKMSIQISKHFKLT
ncbi:Hypothetical protein Nlim_1668 [Candidatus Nitrosarchaeum limnium SFB1]|uniref:Uncharacterized protein n=1 Tax=Candidatus Nitrosarchaeum limnium SFB1 TaxID=886738 RepID=F3KMB9_9ARCH|nr:Hypothetical protein Nlim_1668 [Candidatus Nitrosarchaeum limnium SFB1]